MIEIVMSQTRVKHKVSILLTILKHEQEFLLAYRKVHFRVKQNHIVTLTHYTPKLPYLQSKSTDWFLYDGNSGV